MTPIRVLRPPPEEVDKEYPFTLISHKMNLHTQSRTVLHDWSMEVFPESNLKSKGALPAPWYSPCLIFPCGTGGSAPHPLMLLANKFSTK